MIEYQHEGVKAAVVLGVLDGPVILTISNHGEERMGHATAVVLDIARRHGTPIYTTLQSEDGQRFFAAVARRHGIEIIELRDGDL